MAADEIKRRAKRYECLQEIKVRFSGQDNDTVLALKDISSLGLRVIVARLVKPGDFLEIKMQVHGRNICCKGKVIWALLLRPSLGNISSFDAGIEFLELNSQDKEFLEKLTGA